jgi:hypothetical protein
MITVDTFVAALLALSGRITDRQLFAGTAPLEAE